MNDATNSFVSGLGSMWAGVLAFLPKFLLFLVILVAGYFVSKWIARLVEVVLRRVGFDRMLDRGGVNRAMANSPYPAMDVIRKIVFFSLFLIVLQLAFAAFGPNPISDILTRFVLFLPTLFVSLAIVIISAVLARMVKGIVGAALSNVSYGPVLANATGATVFIVGVFAALSHMGIAPAIVNGLFYAALAIIAGSAIVAIGGGGVAPMRRQWEKAIQRLEQENIRIKTTPSATGASGTDIAEGQEVVAEQPRFGTERTSTRYEPKERGRPDSGV